MVRLKGAHAGLRTRCCRLSGPRAGPHSRAAAGIVGRERWQRLSHAPFKIHPSPLPRYTQASEQTRRVFAQYDPSFEAGSLDGG